jgi:adenine-specific DNA-methyltransferase
MTDGIDPDPVQLATPEASAREPSKSERELVAKLREIFQVDAADLDFGIYRILRQRHDEIVRFLEEDLPTKVKEAFARYESADKVAIQKRLEEAIKAARGLGSDPDTTPLVKRLKQELAGSVDRTDLENEVFSALYSFFNRYYKEGDFISQRRYKEGVYAIPYEGEEVKLYWANQDQYYIKSSEYFHNYAFKLPSERTVRFEVSFPTAEAPTGASDNVSNQFFLAEESPVTTDGATLVIRFEFRKNPDKIKQDELNKQTMVRLRSLSSLARTPPLGIRMIRGLRSS